MQLGIISEVIGNGKICMLPSAFAGYRNLILANIDGRISSNYTGHKENGSQYILYTTDDKGNQKMIKDYVGDGEDINYWVNLKEGDRVINVVHLDGPMTRNGAECSMGSVAIRDKIMRVAKYPQCRGHIIYTNTPGGMAACLPDLRMAFNYAREHGQRVDMLIDGIAASGGAFTSAMCDHVWALNPECEIGSIGMYSSFFTLADGAKNAITSEIYHEVYASASQHKNEWYRAAANGDNSMIESEVNADLAELISSLKADRPAILSEQMSGSMYKAKDVIGSLIDGYSDLKTIATQMIEEWEERQGAAIECKDKPSDQPIDDPEEEEPEDDTDPSDKDEEPEQSSKCNPDEDSECNPDKKDKCNPDEDSECNPDKKDKCNPDEKSSVEQSNTKQDMKQYTAIPLAIGEQVMDADVEGCLTLQPEQADMLEKNIAEHQCLIENAEKSISELNAQIEVLTSKVAELSSSVETISAERDNLSDALSNANESNATLSQQLEEVQTQNEQSIASIKEEYEKNVEAINAEHKAAIDDLNAKIEDLRQRNDDLNASVNDLTSAQGAQPSVGEAPKSNGTAAPTEYHISSRATWDPTLSARENFQRAKAAGIIK